MKKEKKQMMIALACISILSEDCVRFETQNSHYYLSMSPFPLAAVSPLPVRLAACA